MKSKYVIDVLMILVISVFFIVLNQFGLLEKYMEFMLIPMLAVYFTGKYVQRKYNNL